MRRRNNVKGTALLELEKARVTSVKRGNSMTSRVSKSCLGKLGAKRRLLDGTSIWKL